MGFRRFRISKVQCLCGLQGSNTVSSAITKRPEQGLFFIYGFKPVLPGLSGETDKPPAMRVRVEGYTKKFPKLIE